ncbi:sigma-70 family RNA polymerase sigma factor [Echinicola sp. CAU 1574]|uniref:Sigma-70 family RNA polymerase sigma factor n=1 Tax=Echinicola arenosa TaxID=2774144 RepID=A0ABR9AL04_9BACT|nr:sigma-70 family RNA polymerase sigma factor [Echinicola arenosa]MBD8489473.1 sigma-70 family RNA polymerase sigma factor [Echinicola arenosa]
MKNHLTTPIPIPERKVSRNNLLIPYSNDTEMWQAFKDGSNAAFLNIYKKYFNSLFSYGIRIKDNEDLVKDAIQDVFLDLKKNCRGLGNTDSIKFYLFKCLKRKIFKQFKVWEGQREELVLQDSFGITFSHEQTLINKQIDLEKARLIDGAIQQLSPRKREAIYYVFYEGMSYQQVSELMELCDAKSARDLVYKALRCLRNSAGFLPVIFSLYVPI